MRQVRRAVTQLIYPTGSGLSWRQIVQDAPASSHSAQRRHSHSRPPDQRKKERRFLGLSMSCQRELHRRVFITTGQVLAAGRIDGRVASTMAEARGSSG